MTETLPNGLYDVYAYPEDSEHPDDIAFELTPEARAIPPAYSQLKSNIERTLSVLRSFHEPSSKVFKEYYYELLALAQYGLKGPTAQPQQAEITLSNLQQRYHNSQKGKIISAHMSRTLTRFALFFIPLGLIALGAIISLPQYLDVELELDMVASLPGLALGLALTAFLRCKTVTFYDLHAIDADRFSPFMRAAFALVILIVSAIFLQANVFQIEIGDLEFDDFDDNALSALILGLFVGISQEPLIARIEAITQKSNA